MADNKKYEYGNRKEEVKFKKDPRAGFPKGQTDEEAWKTEYPRNDVTVWPCGHIMEFDNTKDKERIHIRHCSGTGFEILKDGCRIDTVSANEYKYNKGGLTHTVQGNMDAKIHGHSRSSISGGTHTEVAGDSSFFTKGSVASFTGGNQNIHIKGTTKMIAQGGATFQAGKGGSPSEMRITMHPDGSIYISSKEGKITIEAKNLSLKTEGTLNIAANKLSLGYNFKEESEAPGGTTSYSKNEGTHKGWAGGELSNPSSGDTSSA